MLLRKGIYPYEYTDSWERFDETLLPVKELFYTKLNIKGISDKDYAHGQKVWEVFEIKNLDEYHDLYVQCDTLLLADVFESFRDKCIELYELYPAHSLTAPGLASLFKKDWSKIRILTDIDMLLMVEKDIPGGIFQATHRYAKENNKYMNNYDKSII